MSAAETPTAPGLQRIADAFAQREGRAALMPYMMGGYPDLEASRAIATAYADGGADLVELGIPYSDPLADGPVIHAAGTAALNAGTTTDDVLGLAEGLAERVGVVVMCYANLVLVQGPDTFARRLVDAGVSGLIVPDLPLEEADEVRSATDAAGLALVPLVAPTTTDERMARIGAVARGFIYTVSTVGTTGERDVLADTLGDVLDRARASTDVPLAVGFGIGTPVQAVEAARAGADGVIIGTRLVRAAGEGEDICELVAQFAQALHQAPSA
jgi:tryptophan synthase alpha chain